MEAQAVVMPTLKHKIKLKNYPNILSGKPTQRHEADSFRYKVLCCYNENFTSQYLHTED